MANVLGEIVLVTTTVMGVIRTGAEVCGASRTVVVAEHSPARTRGRSS